MKFRIEKEIFEKYPELVVGVVVARGINNTGISEDVLSLIREKEKEIKENFETETLSQNPKIAPWRMAFSAFGAKPKEYKCSVENLYRMVLKGTELRHINKIVDIYNYISIKHMMPVGGDDIDKVEGDIILRLADGTETFRALNSEEVKNPKLGEVVYSDEKEILCRRWNWRECDKSKMTETTKNVMLVVEGLPPVDRATIQEVINEISELVKKNCAGELKSYLLDSNNTEIDIYGN
ncbi:MAG: hypothetical protein HQ539_00615 [Parcubacteria group bacterium]|nr:hypothetical protein [Parcubacteria group bacterium]